MDLYNDALVNQSVRRGDREAYFKPCIGWSQMGGGNKKNFNLLNCCVCGTATPTILSKDEESEKYVLGFLNTKIPTKYIECFNPLMSTYISDICNLPYVYKKDIYERVIEIVNTCISYAREDWDSFETSWDFKQHPFLRWANELWDVTAIGATMSYYYGKHIKVRSPMELCYLLWQGECNERFNTTVESAHPDVNNAYGAIGFIGRTKEFGEQWLYSRPDLSKIPDITSKHIEKVLLHIPILNGSSENVDVYIPKNRFCSFGSTWNKKVNASPKITVSNNNCRYLTIDVTTIFVNRTDRTLVYNEGLILKKPKGKNDFIAISTGDCYSAPQILEIKSKN